MTNNKKAIKILRKRQRFCKVIAEYANETVKADELREVEALDMAISALRPVSRERVEKVWRGEWELHGGGKNGRGGIWHCTRCEKSYPYKNDFCPMCGAPMTDEAVEMVMKRMEALHEITE